MAHESRSSYCCSTLNILQGLSLTIVLCLFGCLFILIKAVNIDIQLENYLKLESKTRNKNFIKPINRMHPTLNLPVAEVIRDMDYFSSHAIVSSINPKPKPRPNLYYVSNFSVSPGQGNQMFQYASLYSLALRNNATLLIPEKLLIRRSFAMKGAKIVSKSIANQLGQIWKNIVFKDCCRFYGTTELGSPESLAFTGYMQSWQYFHPQHRQAILEQFQFMQPIRDTAKGYLLRSMDRFKDNVTRTLIGVHIRRGEDLTLSLQNQEHGHIVAPLSYIQKAMDYFRERLPNALFIVCSDQPRWSKSHLTHDDVIVISSGQREVDMCILTMCEHTVMTVGTFSWWSAYLTGGMVIYYDGWPKPNTRLDNMLNKTEFFLPDWIAMSH